MSRKIIFQVKIFFFKRKIFFSSEKYFFSSKNIFFQVKNIFFSEKFSWTQLFFHQRHTFHHIISKIFATHREKIIFYTPMPKFFSQDECCRRKKFEKYFLTTILIAKIIFFISTTSIVSLIDNFLSQLTSQTLAHTHNTLVSCHQTHHSTLTSSSLIVKNSYQQLFCKRKFFFRTHLPEPN